MPTWSLHRGRRNFLCPDREYDVVLALFFMVHIIEDAKWFAAIDVISKALAPEGYGILMDKIVERRNRPTLHVLERSIAEHEAAFLERGMALKSSTFRDCYLIRPIRSPKSPI